MSLFIILTAGVSMMTYDECRAVDVCRVEGVMTVEEVDHVRMGRLGLADGRCVSVSLPPAVVEQVHRNGMRRMMIEGRVYPAPSGDPNLTTLRVDGRRVGWNNACGDFYVFVR